MHILTDSELEKYQDDDQYHILHVDDSVCVYRVSDLWSCTDTPFFLPLKEIPRVEDIIQYVEDENDPKRVEAASLDYPIVLSKYVGIVDGCHRIYKAHQLGKEEILVSYLNRLPEPVGYRGDWKFVNSVYD